MSGKILQTFFTKLFSTGFSFLTVILTTQFLGAEGRGMVSLILLTINVIMLVNDLVGGSSVVFLVPRNKLTDILIPAYSWAFIVCLLGFGVLSFVNIVPGAYVPHISILAFFFAVFSINCSVFLGKKWINTRNGLQFLMVSLNLVILSILFLGMKSAEVFSYIRSLYVAYGVCLLISLYFIARLVDFKSMKSGWNMPHNMLKFGFWSQSGHVIQFFNYRLSYFFLADWAGTSSLGIFSVGVTLSEAIWMIGNSFALIQHSKIVNTDNRKFAAGITVKYLKYSVVLTTLAVLVLMMIPVDLFRTIFGEEFGELKKVIFSLAPGIVALGISTMFSHYYSAIGKYKVITLANFIAFLVTVTANVLLIPRFGFVGAGFAASLSYISLLLFLGYLFLKNTGTGISGLIPDREIIDQVLRIIKLGKQARINR